MKWIWKDIRAGFLTVFLLLGAWQMYALCWMCKMGICEKIFFIHFVVLKVLLRIFLKFLFNLDLKIYRFFKTLKMIKKLNLKIKNG
jgi:hypothetical protein